MSIKDKRKNSLVTPFIFFGLELVILLQIYLASLNLFNTGSLTYVVMGFETLYLLNALKNLQRVFRRAKFHDKTRTRNRY